MDLSSKSLTLLIHLMIHLDSVPSKAKIKFRFQTQLQTFFRLTTIQLVQFL
jgi:hypothetical protein